MPTFRKNDMKRLIYLQPPRLIALIALIVLMIVQSNSGVAQPHVPDNSVSPTALSASTKFLRIAFEPDASPKTLESAIVRFVNADGATIDLISVLHHGERGYYRKLDSAIAECEVVLCEGFSMDSTSGATVLTNGTSKRIEPQYARYNQIPELLGFVRQEEGIDYSRSSLIPADLRWQEFRKIIESDNVSMPEVSRLDAMMKKLVNKMLIAPRAELRGLRRLFALGLTREGERLEKQPETGVMLRNACVLDELRAQLRDGKKHIGILFGAYHMPDLQAHLIRDFGMAPSDRQWLEAWDLR